MNKNYYNLDKFAEKHGVDLRIGLSFFESEDGKKMQLCACTISDGYKAIDYAYVVGETTLEDVIKEFLDNQD